MVRDDAQGYPLGFARAEIASTTAPLVALSGRSAVTITPATRSLAPRRAGTLGLAVQLIPGIGGVDVMAEVKPRPPRRDREPRARPNAAELRFYAGGALKI